MQILQTNHALLSRLLPDVRPEDLSVRQGQFHQVVIGTDRVVCLPRTRAAAVRLPHRAAVLRLLAGFELGFRTPRPLLESSTYGTGQPQFLVLSRVPGAPLEADALEDPKVAEAAAAQYVALLTELAGLGAVEKVRAALPAPRDRWRQFAADVRTELFWLMSDGGRQRAERELTALDSLPHLADAVVHGDLGAENVLWERKDGLPVLSGVIDWDEVTIGDPAEDLAAVDASYGTGFLNRVLTLGGWSDSTMATRIAIIRATFALQQALSAHRDDDEEQLTDGLTGYR
ncbi:viomycin phosphotransferase [Nonomuraea sp. NBC_01738]|uniref:viomycin phosphotransferase n=1 Tax=Nonomuraea sp. NBC_01738 TaxID=2976003 RepID=UPI002E0EEB03|nr:viomycin phosphotransferase [Nonomuraea sp. NBC_01738]